MPPASATPPGPAGADARAVNILLVDDDRTSLLAMEQCLEQLGHRVHTAGNGAEAFALLRENPGMADLVMTDRTMPVMDGLGLTRRLKREPQTRHMPVIILTGAADSEDVSAGIEAGAFYYLTKPPVEKVVASVVNSAIREVARQRKLRADLAGHQEAFRFMQAVKFRLRRPEEVEPVVSMLASMQDTPDRAIQGIYELVQNAVEHGVLRFGFQEKARLMMQGQWQQALAERSQEARFAESWVEAAAIRRQDGIYISVADNGPGFDWRPYLTADPSRAAASCGRGISRAANFAFDRLSFDKTGNKAIGFIAQERDVKW
ncbi:response regulator [Teichococcus aestuarii]|uniref:response regulator n=1 Tax=Teichococcus aestuarii TaxID=568898 RepID=UPI003621E475